MGHYVHLPDCSLRTPPAQGNRQRFSKSHCWGCFRESCCHQLCCSQPGHSVCCQSQLSSCQQRKYCIGQEKPPVCCVQPVSNTPELQRERPQCTGRETAGFTQIQPWNDSTCSSLLCLSIPAVLLPVSGRFSYLLCLLHCHISVQIDSSSYCTRQA